MTSILFTADLHLTPNPKDHYRWGIFKFLIKQAEKFGLDLIVLGGDLTDNKDEHPSWLVNRLVAGVRELAKWATVVILRGNHDYIDENEPFFGFLDGVNDNILFVTQPYPYIHRTNHGATRLLFIPNTKDPDQAWKGIEFDKFDYIFCHQTFDGCVAENGAHLRGIPTSIFGKTKALIYSGDIHKPQRVGGMVTYVGAPYRMRFGDAFRPRVLLIERDDKTGKHSEKSLHTNGLMKHLVEIKASDPAASFKERLKTDEDICEGDQVKVRVSLDRSEFPDWPKIKKAIHEEAKAQGLELFGPELISRRSKALARAKSASQERPSPERALDSYGKKERLSRAVLEAGRGFLGEAQGKA